MFNFKWNWKPNSPPVPVTLGLEGACLLSLSTITAIIGILQCSSSKSTLYVSFWAVTTYLNDLTTEKNPNWNNNFDCTKKTEDIWNQGSGLFYTHKV